MKKAINTNGTIEKLCELIELCQHGQQSFAAAAHCFSSVTIKNFCFEQSQLRAQFHADLQDEMRGLEAYSVSEWPLQSAQVAEFACFNPADNHQQQGQESALIAACKQADELALRQYEEALALPLPATVRSVIEYQYRSIKRTHEQIKAWEHKDGAS